MEEIRSLGSIGVALTVYNQNFALVKDRRLVELGTGRNTVIIENVASQIDPTSVHFKSLTAPNAVAVREQNYRYDLINPTTLLNKSVGKKITIRQNPGEGRVEEVSGILMAPLSLENPASGRDQHNGTVVRTEDGRLLLNPKGEMVLHEMPEGLVPIPELVWLVDCTQSGAHESEISYMTNGVTWSADYVVVVANDDRSVDLTGWVTLNNRSGATYENASLQLVAGDVRRIQPEPIMEVAYSRMAKAGSVPAAPQFVEESLFEYHLYTLDGTTTVRNNEQKQMTLISANNVPAVKKFIYDGRKGFWGILNPEGYRPGEGYDTSDQAKVNVVVEIENKEPAMGMPLPKGKMRLFQADKRGGLQFVGEDRIDHTPKDETLRLYVGDSFDLVGEHKRTKWDPLESTCRHASLSIL